MVKIRIFEIARALREPLKNYYQDRLRWSRVENQILSPSIAAIFDKTFWRC